MIPTRPCTYFMLLRSTRHWREFDQDTQRAHFDTVLSTVFNGFPDLRMSHYTTGASDERCTDVVVWETTDAAQYRDAVDTLRAQAFFGAPMFEIVDVIAGLPDNDEPSDDPLVAGASVLEASP